ncbi:hypothetical protein ACWGNN_00855 [Streptomyces sp. NPDC055817]
MAMQQLSGAQMRADHPAPLSAADRAARKAASHVRLTPDVQRAVTRFTVAAARYDELVAKPASKLTASEFEAIRDARQVVAESFATLAEAGMTHLVEGP